jgi:V/A-type H+-transporting ATPase subunit C
MAGSLRKYAFINAKLRARISMLLSNDVFSRLMKAQSLHEALGYLQDTPFRLIAEVFSKTGDLKLGELELLRQEVSLYKDIEKYVRGDALKLVHALTARFEIDYLKNAIRVFFDRKVRGRSVDTAAHYVIRDVIHHDLSIDRIINAASWEEIIHILNKTPYAKTIEENREHVEHNKSLFPLEIALDHLYYTNLCVQAEKLGGRDRSLALRLIGVEIDLLNIDWIIRFQRFYHLPMEEALRLIVPGGFQLDPGSLQEVYHSQNVAPFLKHVIQEHYPGLASLISAQTTDSTSRFLLIERVLEQIIMHEIRRILSGNPFTIGIILSYFILKRNEMRKVQTILNAKQYNIAEDRIKGVI